MTILAWIFCGAIAGVVAYVLCEWYYERHGKEL